MAYKSLARFPYVVEGSMGVYIDKVCHHRCSRSILFACLSWCQTRSPRALQLKWHERAFYPTHMSGEVEVRSRRYKRIVITVSTYEHRRKLSHAWGFDTEFKEGGSQFNTAASHCSSTAHCTGCYGTDNIQVCGIRDGPHAADAHFRLRCSTARTYSIVVAHIYTTVRACRVIHQVEYNR